MGMCEPRNPTNAQSDVRVLNTHTHTHEPTHGIQPARRTCTSIRTVSRVQCCAVRSPKHALWASTSRTHRPMQSPHVKVPCGNQRAWPARSVAALAPTPVCTSGSRACARRTSAPRWTRLPTARPVPAACPQPEGGVWTYQDKADNTIEDACKACVPAADCQKNDQVITGP